MNLVKFIAIDILIFNTYFKSLMLSTLTVLQVLGVGLVNDLGVFVADLCPCIDLGLFDSQLLVFGVSDGLCVHWTFPSILGQNNAPPPALEV